MPIPVTGAEIILVAYKASGHGPAGSSLGEYWRVVLDQNENAS